MVYASTVNILAQPHCDIDLCDSQRNAATLRQANDLAASLYESFLSENAALQVNLPHTIINTIMATLQLRMLEPLPSTWKTIPHVRSELMGPRVLRR
jgi:hypothetical protein